MAIKFDNFGGMAPKIAPHLLPQQSAQSATNCRFRSGALEPLKAKALDSSVTKTGTLLSLFRYWPANVWFSWTTDVNAVNSQIANDPWARVYFTGDGVPKMTANDVATSGGTNYPTVSYNLGLPAPANSIIAAAAAIPVFSAAATYAVGALVTYNGTAYLCNTAIAVAHAWNASEWDTIDPSTIETRAYVYTYVSAYGEEGPPCLASNLLDLMPGQGTTLSNFSGAPAGAYNVTQKRIYRTNTGTNGTEYQLVATIPVAQSTFTDNLTSDSLGSVMVSATWVAPPTGLQGLTALPCGSLVGFSGNEVSFSVQYEPHAWPLEYRVSVDFPVVAIGAYGNYLLITTTGNPYVMVVQDPSNMTPPERLESGQACVSKRSMVDMGDSLLYAAPDGLQRIASGSFDIATADILSRDDWQALNPSSIVGFLWDGKYIGLYNNGTAGAFVFDPATKDFTLASDPAASAGFTDLKTGKLYLLSGQNVYQWDAGTALTYTWRSRVLYAARPINMGFGRVFASAYPVTLKVYVDGALKHTQSVADNLPFPLPSGSLGSAWEIELSGTGRVNLAVIATNMEDLKQ